MKKAIAIVLICFSCFTVFAQWQRMPGEGYDIGAGANGTTWVIGSGYSIHRWTGTAWQAMPGNAARLDVDAVGSAWVVNQAGNIFRWNGSGWAPISGQARDIGIGANGTVWAIGSTAVGGGYNILRWTGSSWETMPGGAVRIDVDPTGNAWVVNSAGNIFRWNGAGWVSVSGQGRDVGIGADGTVWLVGWNAVAGGFPVYRWNGSAMVLTDGGLENISGGQDGAAWGTNSSGMIWKRAGNPQVMTRFNPANHGFKFENDFVSNFAGIDFYGLCGGMAYSALDYFNRSMLIPSRTTPPELGTPLRQYIYDRQQNSTTDNLDKWTELTVNPFGARTNEFFNWGLQGFNGGRLQELRGEIDAGRPVPIGLFKGGNGGFNTHHQVLVIGYQLGRYTGDLGQYKEELRIFVYDSNFPGRTMTLAPNISNATYFYLEEPTCSWMTYFVDKKYRLRNPLR
jgi:hypothetical protein